MPFAFVFSVGIFDIFFRFVFCTFSARNRRTAAKTCKNEHCFSVWRLVMVLKRCDLKKHAICISTFIILFDVFIAFVSVLFSLPNRVAARASLLFCGFVCVFFAEKNGDGKMLLTAASHLNC